MIEPTNYFHEWYEDGEKILHNFYTEVYLTVGKHLSIAENPKTNVQSTYKFQSTNGKKIKCNDMFPEEGVRRVLTVGIAGIGKTLCVQKFILDWAKEVANQHIDFIFVLHLWQLNSVEKTEYTIISLLHYLYPDLKYLNENNLMKLKIMFIFEGFGECSIPVSRNTTMEKDLWKPMSLDKLIINLMRGYLLPNSFIWITSRPAAIKQLSKICGGRFSIYKHTELHGFNDDQKDDYFKKKIRDEAEADKLIGLIKKSKTLYIMCQIPLFCWMLATVFLDQTSSFPNTVTGLYISFLLIEIKRRNQKNDDYESDDEQNLRSKKDEILKLAKLAHGEFMNCKKTFRIESLKSCDINLEHQTSWSGLCTEFYLHKISHSCHKHFAFVHFSIQEFLAALYAFHTFSEKKEAQNITEARQKHSPSNSNMDNLNTQNSQVSCIRSCVKWLCCWKNSDEERGEGGNDKSEENINLMEIGKKEDWQNPLTNFLKKAVDESVRRKDGHQDLYLRFLMGISMKSNQDLLQGLLEVKDSSNIIIETADYIRKKLKEKPACTDPNKFMNLLLCLLEMNDNCVHEEIKQYIKHRRSKELSVAECSRVAYLFQMSEETLDEFELSKYNTSREGQNMLLAVLRVCKKAR